jgi:hypothetical protein
MDNVIQLLRSEPVAAAIFSTILLLAFLKAGYLTLKHGFKPELYKRNENLELEGNYYNKAK